MKNVFTKLSVFCAILLILISPNINRVNAQSAADDEELERLKKVVEIITKANALPINFQGTTYVDGDWIEEVAIDTLGNLKTQAALLNQLPAGTKVEIGVHTFPLEETLFSKGGPQASLELSQKRAELVRQGLIKLGVKISLTTKGYGDTKPIASNATVQGQLKNQRVEYRVEKMPNGASNIGKTSAQNSPGETAPVSSGNNSGNAIVAGKGWEKVFIGATQAEIEAALGAPEKFYKGNMILPNPSAHYFSRGIIVVYDAETNLVRSIDFVGDPAQLVAENYAGTFRRAAVARTDKNIQWGASAAQIIGAYGAPKYKTVERRNNGAEEVTLIYDQIVFTLSSDKLYYINVTPSNEPVIAALQKRDTDKAAYEKSIGETKPSLAYKAEYVIAAEKGTDKIFLGASRAAVEAAFGRPDEFVDEDAGLFQIYEANYYSKGVQVEYDPKTKVATSIIFFGETPKTGTFGKFSLFPGATDKGIRWGVSPSDVMKIYGKPVNERTHYDAKLGKSSLEEMTYKGVTFGFHENRLYFISIDTSKGK